mgnify:CR=1 FL=1
MRKPSLIVLAQYDPEYILKVLAHGGVNTFPECKGVCSGCETEIFFNSVLAGEFRCPKCGGEIRRTSGGQHFSKLAGWQDACKFIERAARRG